MLQSAQSRMILWTSVIVVGLGLLIMVLMLQPPTAEDSQVHSARYLRTHPRPRTSSTVALNPPAEAAPTSREERKPASQKPVPLPPDPAEPSVDELATHQAIDLTLECKGPQKTTYPKGVSQIRLTGIACAGSADVTSTEVRNDSNGSSAAVFPTGARAFTTDYIPLNVGENKIRILNTLKDGVREDRLFVIVREANAAQNE